MYLLAGLGYICSMDQADGIHRHHAGSWVCQGSWLAMKKKMSGGLYNSTIKKLCPQMGFGRKGQLWAVLWNDNCKRSPMGHWLGEKQQQWANYEQITSSTWRNRYLEDAYQQLTAESIPIQPAWREEAWVSYTLPTLLKKDRQPFLQLLPRQQSALRALKGPSLSVESMYAHGFALKKF